MQTVGTHGLFCPEPDDYAAVALYMQALGTQIDADLDAQNDLLASFQDRPTIVVTNSANVTVAAGGQTHQVFDTVLFDNSTFLSFTTGFLLDGSLCNLINIGSGAGAPVTIPYLQGNYSVGVCTRQTATGAVTAFSERQSTCTVKDTSLPGNALVDGHSTMTDITYDSNTGGNEAELIQFSFDLSRTSGVVVDHVGGNTNVASSVNILAGALMWVTFNGPLSIVEVA